jgi:hypothetical protein
MPYNMDVKLFTVLLTTEIPYYYQRSFWVILILGYTYPAFMGQIIHFVLDCFTLEDRKDRLSQNTGNY